MVRAIPFEKAAPDNPSINRSAIFGIGLVRPRYFADQPAKRDQPGNRIARHPQGHGPLLFALIGDHGFVEIRSKHGVEIFNLGHQSAAGSHAVQRIGVLLNFKQQRRYALFLQVDIRQRPGDNIARHFA
ncbi:MAG: hypothetical protein RL367_2083 [Pseudomonadota bacterium]